MEEQKKDMIETEDNETSAAVTQEAGGEEMSEGNPTETVLEEEQGRRSRSRNSGQFRRYTRQEPDTESEASCFSEMNLRLLRKCTWNL